MSASETIADIVAEMRKRMKSHYYQKVARNIMHQYADRIEAAWKREWMEIEYAKPMLCKTCAHETAYGCEIFGCLNYEQKKGDAE